ncbi:MAG: phosphoribosylanthranilate isomerase [Armatimonadota bacterium]
MRIKVCCIASMEEARLAVGLAASAVGLVSAMPSGPGVIPEALIAEIAATVPPGVSRFLLTCSPDPAEIAAQQRRTGTEVLQLCDRLEPEDRRFLRRELPGVRLVQVIHVTGRESLEDAREAAETADALLLDSGRPDLPVKELGGTGRVHDWTVSRRIVETARVPVYLAGGLTPENAAEAVRAARPFGLDVCSGVRLNGSLDEKRLAAFIRAAKCA